MKIVNCIHPADTSLGEITKNTRYLILKEYVVEHEGSVIRYSYEQCTIFMNQGAIYDFFTDRFKEERIL